MKSNKPKILALNFLLKYEPKARKSARPSPKGKKCQALVPSLKAGKGLTISETGQILLPGRPALEIPEFQPPRDITPQLQDWFEELLGKALHSLDPNRHKGFLEGLFGDTEVARSEKFVELFSNIQAVLAQAESTDRTIRALNRSRLEELSEQFRAKRQAIEEWARMQYAVRSAARWDAVEAARSMYETKSYEEKAQKERFAALPPPPPPQPVDEATLRREEARRRRREDIEMGLEEQEDKAAASEERVARAKNRCTEIYRDLGMRDGEKQARIQRVLDEYSLDWSILPTAIEELMERSQEEVEDGCL